MPQIQDNWSELLIPVISHFYDLGEKSVPNMREALFGPAIPSILSEEKGTGIGSTGSEAWDEFSRGGQPGELDFDQGYTETYTHVEYPVNFTIRKQLILNDQYGIMSGNFRRIGVSAGIKMERDAASILNNAFSGSFPGADGVALCSASHPASPAKSGTLLNNTGTSVLTKTSVSATRIAMMKFVDDKNDPVGVMPNELWVPPDLQDKAIEIVGSALDPDSANNAVNPQAGRWAVKTMQRLTGTKAWFMVDSVQRNLLVNWYEREPYQIMLVDEDTVWIKWQAKLHYSFGFDGWRWIYGHNPA
jgi:hypothetical protein